MIIKRAGVISAVILLLLMVPLIAMQFTDEVEWDAGDFGIAALILSGAGWLINYVLTKVNARRPIILLTGVIILIFFLLWAELAVGIFGTPFAGK
ncbi:MAG: hypothetical protein Kow00127_21920 [Bacteroidales bacterium]